MAALTLMAPVVAHAGVAPATQSQTVMFTIPSTVSLDASGCPSATVGVTDFGSVARGSSITTTGDCDISFGSSNDSAMLRVAQTDGIGSALVSGGNSFPDYLSATSDWSTGTGMFGACLRTVGGGVVSDWATTSACGTTDANPWNHIPQTTAPANAKIAHTTAPGTATVSLRFGARVWVDQPTGTYTAQVTFEAVSPNV